MHHTDAVDELLNSLAGSSSPIVPGTLRSASAPAPKLRQIDRKKFNSTGTVFMSTSINSADVDEIILCLSRSLGKLIKKMEGIEPRKNKEIFSEQKYPLGDGKTDVCQSPTCYIIQDFLKKIFETQCLSPECGVMAAVYIDRLLENTGITFHALNWRRIVLGALLISNKVWEDLAVWNIDFLSLFCNLTLKNLNHLERDYLIDLNYSVALTASVYAKYYFELRSLSDITEEFFPSKPLDAKMACLLEARSVGLEEKVKMDQINAQRSGSLNPYQSNTTLGVEEIQSKYANKDFMVRARNLRMHLNWERHLPHLF